MKPGLKPGASVVHRLVVKGWMKPHLDGMVRHPLYATWAMVYHMEVAARKLLAPYLGPDEEAVGGAVLVKHLRPTAVGTQVRVLCRLVRVRGNRVTTRLDVFARGRKIGEGSHQQVVMPRDRFAKLLRDSRSRGEAN